jgi:hypothetical protein
MQSRSMQNGGGLRTRDTSVAKPLRTALAVQTARPFDELCSALFLLTASISRARKTGGALAELAEIEAHAASAIAIARFLGESTCARMAGASVSVSAVARDIAVLLEALPPPRPEVTLLASVTPDFVALPRATVEADLARAVDSLLATSDAASPIEIAIEPEGPDEIVVRMQSSADKTVDVRFKKTG